MRQVVHLFIVHWFCVFLCSQAALSQDKVSANKPKINAQLTVNQANLVQSAELALESFEGVEFPPPGWRKITNFNGTGWIQSAADSAVAGFDGGTVDTPSGGGRFVALASWVTGDADGDLSTSQATEQWLITPQIVDVQTGDSLSFYLKYFNRFGDNLDVWISTADSIIAPGDTIFAEGDTIVAPSDTTVAQFDTLMATISFVGPGNNEWQVYSYSLVDFVEPGSNVFIGFRERVLHNSAEGDALFLDLIEIRSLVTSVADLVTPPSGFALAQNFPNPFNPSTTISFTLQNQVNVSLRVFNLVGNVVAVPVDRRLYGPGAHQVNFDASKLPSGIYYYRLEAGEFRDTKRMLLLK